MWFDVESCRLRHRSIIAESSEFPRCRRSTLAKFFGCEERVAIFAGEDRELLADRGRSSKKKRDKEEEEEILKRRRY